MHAHFEPLQSWVMSAPAHVAWQSFPPHFMVAPAHPVPLQVRLQSAESWHVVTPWQLSVPSHVIEQLAAVLQSRSPAQAKLPMQVTVQRPEPHWMFLHAAVPQVTSQSPVGGHVTLP